MSNVLTQATNQWMSRPADERFSSLADLHAAVSHHREVAVEATNVNVNALRITTGKDDAGATIPLLVGENGTEARFTHHSFGQFARRVGAPASYLRRLSPGLVSANLNEGIRKYEGADDGEKGDNLLFAQNGALVLRAALSPSYTRIWNTDITGRLIRLTEQAPEWQPAPAAFDGSRGLYASDKDMFAFLVDNDRRIFESLPGGGLGRGFFVSNSEVGDASFRITTFLYEYICGNHRVWGASGVKELRIPHIGNADERAFAKLTIELRKYADATAADEEAKIESAMRFQLGATKDEVLDAIFKLGVSKRLGAQALALGEVREDWYGSPRSAWGVAGALTEIARDLPHADKRVELERQAGKIMQIAF